MCCGILVCGANTSKVTMSEPPRGYKHPNVSVYCPFCTHSGNPIFRQKITRFTFFFIPLCRVDTEYPYIACSVCDTILGINEFSYCKSCTCILSGAFKFCVRCGEKVTDESKVHYRVDC